MTTLNKSNKLFEMTKLINSKFELHEICKILVDAIAGEIAKADLVGFFLKQPDGKFRGYVANDLPVDITELYIDPEDDLFVKDILTNRKSEYIPDTSKDPRPEKEKIKLTKIESMLGLPIIVNEEIFALVFVHDYGKSMNLTEEQIETTEAFVNMASVAISNIQMFERTQDLLKREQLLLDATNSLSKSLSLHEVLKSCFDFLIKTTGIQDVGIHLYNESERMFTAYSLSSVHFTVEDWKGKHSQGIRLSIDDDLFFKEVVTLKKAIAIEDVYADPRPNHKACKMFDIESLLLIPMVAKGQVFGTIAVPSVGKKRLFSLSEIELCQSIADITATALSNALYAENLDSAVKERTAELQQVNFKLEGLVNELETANLMKNDFIASISHELRTPITAIKGTIDIFKKGILGGLNPQQLELIEMSDKAVDRLLNQVNTLLDFAKLESGTFELDYEEIEVDDIIGEVVSIMDSLINRKRQTVVKEVEIGNRIVPADRQRILQVLLNLLSNANKFTPEFGEITIKGYPTDVHYIMEVHDNGIGIPFDKQDKIFNKFYQANNQLNGTGLGLAISKQFIEMHGGEISFSSTEGKGSIFQIKLQLKEK
jgi:signal transduction histidine kinase